MKLNVNELQFDICVPVSETMGEPEIGRRFKGTIWLQGYINFNMNNRRKSRKAHYGIIFCFRVSINAEIAEAAGIVRTIPNVPHSP